MNNLKDRFIMFPAKEMCTSIVSLAPPRSGKTYIMINTVWEWIELGMYETIVMILPTYKNEMSDTYKGLDKIPNVFIFESFHEHKIQKFVDEQEKQTKLFKEGKIKYCPRMLFVCDDATGQKNLFKSKLMIRITTENRHLRIHSWVLLHYGKGVIDKKVRENINFFFFYPLKEELMKDVYKQFIDLRKIKIKTYTDFEKIFCDCEEKHKFPVMLVLGREAYDPDASTWFENDKSESDSNSDSDSDIEIKKRTKKINKI